METFGSGGMQALADLIAPKEESDSEDEQPSNYYAKLTPGNIGTPKTSTGDADSKSTKLVEKTKDSSDIWNSEEVNVGAEYDDVYDTRIAPDYEIVYKQAVGSEDVYLGMGNRTPATSSCEDMVIRVKLPGAVFKDVNVDLSDKFLNVRSPKFKLGLHLPHPCDSKNGKAKWISDKNNLEVTVRMKRDYDFINF